MLKRRLGRPEALGEPVVFSPQRGPLDLKTREGLLDYSRLLCATGRWGDHSRYAWLPIPPGGMGSQAPSAARNATMVTTIVTMTPRFIAKNPPR